MPPDSADARLVACYIVDLWAAGGDCRNKLNAAVRALEEE